MQKRALIIGISGQDGSLLASLLLSKGYLVYGTSRDHEACNFYRLKSLGILSNISLSSLSPCDIGSLYKLLETIQPHEVYNLSGQSSVGLSYQLPQETFDSIANVTLNILEAARHVDFPIRIYNASSSEMFGDTCGNIASERTSFNPISPYALAKLTAYHYTSMYRECYGLFAVSGILFNHESIFRSPRFVTRKISLVASRIAHGSTESLHLGNLYVQRDWGWAPDYVPAMWSMLQLDYPRDIVISTGKAATLLSFAETIFNTHNLKLSDHLIEDESLLRPSDINYSCGDPSLAFDLLSWKPTFFMADVARSMAINDLNEFSTT